MKIGDFFQKSYLRFFFIAGPCVLESLDLGLEIGKELARIGRDLNVTIIFKSSFDKANRTSIKSFRGPGLELGLKWLFRISQETGLPITTDIHNPEQAEPVAQVADIIQIPAFLSRQTDLLWAAAKTDKIINIKKGQFLAPWDMSSVLGKMYEAGNKKVWLTERGSCFGYNNLVVDIRSMAIMKKLDHPVIFDATHSVQLPGAGSNASAGEREFVPVLARAATAAGCNGIFMEVHPEPDKALCDGANSWPLNQTKDLMQALLTLGNKEHVC